MNCTDAWREALTRDFSSTAPSAPTSTPAPSQGHAAEAGREDVAGQPLRRRRDPEQEDPEVPGVVAAGAVAESGPAMALAKGAMVVNVEVIGQL